MNNEQYKAMERDFKYHSKDVAKGFLKTLKDEKKMENKRK